MLPVIVINGPLGSGKTTLIHELLKYHINAERTLWLKTEFGDESIDEYVLMDTGVKTQSLTGGCICHVLLSELDGKLTEIEKIEDIDHIIIETSGMSHPAPVTQTIERHPSFIVAQTILVVDTPHAKLEKYPKPEVLAGGDYIPYSLIIFNKYDFSLSPDAEGALEKVLDPWFAGAYANIEKLKLPNFKKDSTGFHEGMEYWATRLKKDIEKAFLASPKSVQTSKVDSHNHEEAEDHEGDMETLSFKISAEEIIDRKAVEDYASMAPENVIRIKGIFHTPSGWEFFNWARGTGSWSKLGSEPAVQILLVIGQGIENDPDLQFRSS